MRYQLVSTVTQNPAKLEPYEEALKIVRRQEKRRRWPGHKNLDYIPKMKELRKIITKEMRTAQNKYLDNLPDKLNRNSKEVWKYVKNKKTPSTAIPDIIDGVN